MSGTGFDIANQEYNEISFVERWNHSFDCERLWSDTRRTRIRFEFWKLDSRHVGDLNASVRAKINSSAYSDYSSTQTIASIVATSPEIDNATTILVSGENETAFVVHGSGFVAAPNTSLNYLSLTDGNGGCYRKCRLRFQLQIIVCYDSRHGIEDASCLEFPDHTP